MSKNVRVALVVFCCTLLWFASGTWKAPKIEEQAVVAGGRLTAVKAAWYQAKPYTGTLIARGRTEPNRAVSLRAEVAGRVVAVPAERGAQVAAGAVVCELASEDREQRVTEAAAALKEAELLHQGALKLNQQGLQSEVASARALAALERARAELKRRQLDAANTLIRAPFDAVVERRDVEQGDYMSRGEICAQLLEVTPLKVAAQVSEQQVSQLAIGAAAEVELVGGERLPGTVTYLSQQAAAGTRTYRVEVRIDNPDARLRAGLTARLLVRSAPVAAQRIPSGLLSLGDAGEVGVRLLTVEHQVQFQAVKIIGDDPAGVWVLGLPERTLLITAGQEYVANGERVDVTMDEALMGLSAQ